MAKDPLTGLRGEQGTLGVHPGSLCAGDFDDVIHDEEFLNPLPLAGPDESYTVQRNEKGLDDMAKPSPSSSAASPVL